jgi:hypothetical protein
MFKRLMTTTAVLGVVALTAGSIGPAMGSGGSRHHGDHRGHGDHGDRVRVLSTNTEESFLDLGASGTSLGDEYVFTSRLTRHGRTVGHTGVTCTLTSVARNESQCLGTVWLDGRGQIAIQGLVAGQPDVFDFPITGGTGAFDGATGRLVVREVGQNPTREMLTLYLS